TQRMAERGERTDRTDQAHRAVAQALSIAPTAESVEQPQAEIAQAEETLPSITAIEDVTIRPITPKPSLFREPVEAHPEPPRQLAEPEKPSIPPQAEQPVRTPRMPRIDELPIPAQNQIRARQAETAAAAEKPRQSLLQRLASVGLGRREEEARPASSQAPAQRMAPP